MTNRQGAYCLLLFMVPILIYVFSSDWAFVPMRDGVLIGAFTMMYLGFCVIFILAMIAGPGANELLEDIGEINTPGLVKIVLFLLGAVAVTFWHEAYGFVMLCSLFLAAVSWFAGQTSPVGILIYSLIVSTALYLLFSLLGFDLSIAPGLKVEFL